MYLLNKAVALCTNSWFVWFYFSNFSPAISSHISNNSSITSPILFSPIEQLMKDFSYRYFCKVALKPVWEWALVLIRSYFSVELLSILASFCYSFFYFSEGWRIFCFQFLASLKIWKEETLGDGFWKFAMEMFGDSFIFSPKLSRILGLMFYLSEWGAVALVFFEFITVYY